jgi:Zn-dependent protease
MDFWTAKRRSKAQPIVQTIFWILAFPLQAWFSTYARRAGIHTHYPAGGLLWFFAFILVNVALHEAGHAMVALAVGYKLQIVSIGPLSFSPDHSRVRFRFDLARLFESGGYIGASPVSDCNLRLKEIAVVAAGPAANVLTGLILLAVFVSLPGTAWESWWWLVSLNAFIALGMAVTNLMPLGYCDGTMLLHLIWWTPAGRLLLDRKRVAQMTAEAESLHGVAAFDKEIELREAMLQRSLAFGKDNAFAIAVCHQALGSAYLLVDDWAAAEIHYRKCLEFEAESAGYARLGCQRPVRPAVYFHAPLSCGCGGRRLRLRRCGTRKAEVRPGQGHQTCGGVLHARPGAPAQRRFPGSAPRIRPSAASGSRRPQRHLLARLPDSL